MAPRAIWKGHLEIGQLVCPVALHAAASTSERVAFHIVNRKTGHRVRRVFVDAETGEPVEREDQAKGYETDRGKTIVVEEEELAEAVPESDKTLRVEAFIPCGEVDTLYFDRPYYLTPDGEAAETAFAVIRAGLAKQQGRGDRPHRALPPPARGAHPRAGHRPRRRHPRVRPRGPRRGQGLRRHPGAEARQGDARSRPPHHRHQARQVPAGALRGPLRRRAGRAGQGEGRRQGHPQAEAARGRQAHRPDGGAAHRWCPLALRRAWQGRAARPAARQRQHDPGLRVRAGSSTRPPRSIASSSSTGRDTATAGARVARSGPRKRRPT